MGNYSYEFYKNLNGSSPTYDFIKQIAAKSDKTSRSLLQSIYLRLKKLECNGTLDGMPDFEYIGGKNHKIWQIRVKHSSGYYRFFICRCTWRGSHYIILNYFLKTTNKTPPREIELAERLMDDYVRNCGRGK